MTLHRFRARLHAPRFALGVNSTLTGSVLPVLRGHSVLQGLLRVPIVLPIKSLRLVLVLARRVLLDRVLPQ